MENLHKYSTQEFNQIIALKDFYIDMKICMEYAGLFLKVPYLLLIDLNGYNCIEAKNFISLYEGIKDQANQN